MAPTIDPSISLLKSRIDQGASVQDIYSALFQARTGQKEDAVSLAALSRCVLVHSFDSRIYQGLVTSLPNAPSFSDISAKAAVESVQTDPPRYSIRPSERLRLWQNWIAHKADLGVLSKDLLSRLKGLLSPNDELGLLVFADSGAAERRFRDTYKAADDEFDLAQCDALVRVLEARYELLESPLQQMCRAYRAHQRRRSLFADEYYRSVFYLDRPKLFEGFKEFLDDTAHWMLLIRGSGGMGKTHFQRWAISRGLSSPGTPSIPIARVDCDFLNLSLLQDFPWLLLPRIARQFALQTHDSDFDKFVNEFRGADAILQRGLFNNERLVTLRKDIEDRKAELSNKDDYFISLAGTKQLIVIVDTVEEPLLHFRTGLLEVIKRLANVQKFARGFRLVLSGRYSPLEKIDTFESMYRDQYVPLEVGPFDETESKDYLLNVRSLPETAPVAAIYKKTKGNPFGLSLYANLVLSDPLMDEAKVESHPDFEFAYLIDRIIDRIPDDQRAVRWLLRYAVVPRSLTQEFIRDVLAKPLTAEMKHSRRDKPNEFKGEVKGFEGREIWKKEDEPKIGQVWSDLISYASTNSWISEKDGVVRLQPEVVIPMRRLLRLQSPGLWTTLHGLAAKYYAKRAGSKGAVWDENMVEAIYHQFQAQTPSAVEFWEGCITDLHAMTPAIQKQLASILLSGEFLDLNNKPIEYRKRQPLVNIATIVHARFTVAFAAVLQILAIDEDHTDVPIHVNEISSQWTEIEKHQRSATREVKKRLPFISAVIQVHSGHDPDGKAVERFLQHETKPVYRLAATVLLGRLTHKDKYWREAVSIVRSMSKPLIAPSWIHYQRGIHFKKAGEVANASDSLMKAVRASFTEPGPSSYTSRLLRETADFCLEAGLLTELGKLVDRKERNFEEGAALKLVRGQLAERRLSPNDAIQQFTVATDTTDLFVQARAYVCRARAFATILQQQNAETDWDEAKQRLQELGQQAELFNRTLDCARFYRVGLGNFHHAAAALTDLNNLIVTEDQRFEYQLEQIRRLAPVNVPDSRGLWKQLERNSDTRSLKQRVRIQVIGLALGFTDRPDILVDEIAKVEPVESRFALLEDFDLSSGKPSIARSKKASAALLAAVPPPQVSSSYAAARMVSLANALRVFGDGAEAMKLLRPMATKLTNQPFARRAIENVMIRIDPTSVTDRSELLRRFEQEFSNAPAVRAALQVEEAERLFQIGNLEASRVLSQQARDFVLPHTHWEIRSYRLFAKIAARDGRREEAAGHFDRAIRQAESNNYVALRDELRSESASLPPIAATSGPPSPKPAVPEILQIRITRSGGTLQITHNRGGDSKPYLASGPFAKFIVEGEPYPVELVKRMQAAQDLSGELSQILRLTVVPLQTDLAIQTSDDSVSSVPWESAFRPNSYGFVYRSTGERLSDDDTRWETLVLKNEGFDSSVVLSTNPRPERAALAQQRRGQFDSEYPVAVWQRRMEYEKILRPRTWAEAEFEYLRVGVRNVLSYESMRATSKMSSSLGKNSLADMIHIVGGFEESRRTAILDIDPSRFFEPGSLNSSLTGYPPDRLRPFVILDVNSPLDTYDQARQVFLRNLYAMQLFRYGSVRGVLAAGLTRTEDGSRTVRKIITDSVAEHASMGELHRRIWQSGQTYVPPALFTLYPDLPCCW